MQYSQSIGKVFCRDVFANLIGLCRKLLCGNKLNVIRFNALALGAVRKLFNLRQKYRHLIATPADQLSGIGAADLFFAGFKVPFNPVDKTAFTLSGKIYYPPVLFYVRKRLSAHVGFFVAVHYHSKGGVFGNIGKKLCKFICFIAL